MQCNKKLFPLSFYLVVFGSSLLFLDSSDDGMDKRNHICGMREWTQEHTVSWLGSMGLYGRTGPESYMQKINLSGRKWAKWKEKKKKGEGMCEGDLTVSSDIST